MTQVGHLLTGAAIGVACLPENKSTRWKIIYFAIFGLLANIPDFPFKYWGHHRYFISHSLFMNLVFIIGILPIFIFSKQIRGMIGGWIVIIGGISAWLSHLLLDTFYNHGKGLLMFWPFSEARLALPIPWFSVVKNPPPPLTMETARIFLIELLFYGTVLLVFICLKRFRILYMIITKVHLIL